MVWAAGNAIAYQAINKKRTRTRKTIANSGHAPSNDGSGYERKKMKKEKSRK